MRWKWFGSFIGLCFAINLSLAARTFEVAQRDLQSGDNGDGSREHPWETISEAAENVRPGDKVIIHDGIYRETVIVKASGTAESPILFEAAPGANVVLTGADRLVGWKKSDANHPIYQVPWTHRFIGWSPNMTHPDDEYHRLIGRCEQVVIDGYLLRQVLAERQLAPGTFFADVSNQVLEVWDAGNRDLNDAFVEASVRQEIFRVTGDHVQLRGLHFRYAANMAQHGAVVLAGNFDSLEDCTMEKMNSSGATFSGEHQIIQHCVFRDNGQLGFGANGAHDLLFTGCLVENNNTKNFSRGWEAGGDKLVLCRGAVLEQSRFLRNRGNGIWFDIGNEQCVVRQCLIADNEDSGIFNEISFGLHAHDNVIVGNGFASTAGAWGAQAGIVLSSSPDCQIERNLILGNREGFDFREQNRTTSRIGKKGEEPIWNHDDTIVRNIIAFNRDAQIWGWFDTEDGREWPVKIREQQTIRTNDTAEPADIAGPYVAGKSDGQPRGLSLKQLHLRFEDNVYQAGLGQGWFEWGVTWRLRKSYANLKDFQTALGLDKGGRVMTLAFANLNALDYRLGAETMAALKSCYPQGPIPDVILGMQP
jgi:Right handed beta helix region/Chondroitinase B